MTWLSAILNALLTATLGLVSVGFLANACVDWFRISSREGAAGFFVVGMALLGAIAGAVIGAVTTVVMSPPGGGGFLKSAGVSLGIVAALVGIAAVVCVKLADIPPEIDGNTLDLEVEYRLPAGAEYGADDDWGFTLGSSVSRRQRASESGTVAIENARVEAGRRILPASVFLFTQRGERVIHLQKGSEYIASYMPPIPAKPGKGYEQWSPWGPVQQATGEPWPDTKISYRFRVRQNFPEPPPPEPEEVEAAEFAALTPDAPLESWLPFMRYDAPPERVEPVMKEAEARQSELAKLIASDVDNRRELALQAVPSLVEITPEVRDAVIAEGKEIAAAVGRFNEMNADDPRFYDVQIELRGRFNDWKRAWWSVFHQFKLDGRPPVQEIYDLANVRAKETSMDEIVINAKAILDALPAAESAAP